MILKLFIKISLELLKMLKLLFLLIKKKIWWVRVASVKKSLQSIFRKFWDPIKGDELDLRGKNLIRKVMKNSINASEALLEMIILHL